MIDGHHVVAEVNASDLDTISSYAMGCLQQIQTTVTSLQAVILSPAREHSAIAENFIHNFESDGRLKSHAIWSWREDIDKIRSGQHLLLGTPNVIYEMISKWHVRVVDIKIVVIDNADECFSQNSKDAIYDIFECMPSDVQVCLFSKRMSPEIIEFKEKFLYDPVCIMVRG